MSTRSTVGIKSGNGFMAIYIHYDGYPEHMLANLPNNMSDISDMISQGDGSVIEDGVVIKNVNDYEGPKKYHSKFNWLDSMKQSWCEWYYLWDEENEKWEYGRL